MHGNCIARRLQSEDSLTVIPRIVALAVCLLAFSAIARAQRPNFELDCPAGMVPVNAPGQVTLNTITFKYRQNQCIDSSGNIVDIATKTFSGPILSPYVPKSIVADFGAKCDGRIVTDWTQSSGSTTATSATGAFSVTDVGKIVGINNGISGSPNVLLSTTISTVVNSTTVTTASAPTRTISPSAGGGDGWAAIGTNDDAAFAASTSGGGGRWVMLPANQICTIRSTINVASISDWTMSGFGSKSHIVYLPVTPLSTGVNGSTFFVQSNFSSRRQIANAISIGATSFTLSQSSDGTDLVPNDYLVIADGDPNAAGVGSSEKVNYDMVQVQSVSGTTVNVKSPFRVAFTTSRTFNSGNQNGLGFYRIIPSQTDNGIKLLNFRITAPIAVAPATYNETAIYIFTARNVEVGGVYLNAPKPIATYDSKQLDFHDIFIEGIWRVNPEVASTVDSTFSNLHFSSAGTSIDSTTQATNAALSVDFGSAFNHFNNITADFTGNAGIGCTVAHDNIFNGITIGYVRNATATPFGVVATGCYNNKFDNVNFLGADTTGVAFQFGATSGYVTNVSDANNIIGNNFIGASWATRFNSTGAMSITDSFQDSVDTVGGTGAVRIVAGNQIQFTVPSSTNYINSGNGSELHFRTQPGGTLTDRWGIQSAGALVPAAVGGVIGTTALPVNVVFGVGANQTVTYNLSNLLANR